MTIVAAAIGPDGVWIGSDGRAEGNGTVILWLHRLAPRIAGVVAA